MPGRDFSPWLAAEGGSRQGWGGLLFSHMEVLQKICPLLCVAFLLLCEVPKEERPLHVNLSAMNVLVELRT